MKSICFFASYYTTDNIPYYAQIYLKELKRHFSKVVLLSCVENPTQNDLNFCKKESIDYQFETNEGFDFGMWYKAFQRFDVAAFDTVALVNDSCILFKSLDEFINWSSSMPSEAKGMTISEAVSKHIQSYFIVLNKNAITLTADYFEKHKILKTISEVIETYEIGLSRFLIENGVTISAFVDNNGYKGEYSPYYYCIDYHLSKNLPLIKKKILFVSYRKSELFTLARMNFNINPTHYVDVIKERNKDLLIDFDALVLNSHDSISVYEKIKYALTRKFIYIFRPIYKLIKHA
jgi:lipopolysaccharide biosynthesis protein